MLLTDADLVNAAQYAADRIGQLDQDLIGYAAQSQDAERLTIPAGDRIPPRHERAIVCEPYQSLATKAVEAARKDIMRRIDSLEAKAGGDVSRTATADEIASVTFALERGDLTDAELLALYDQYREKWVIARVLRNEAAKRDISLSASPTENFLQHIGEIRARATSSVDHRWDAGNVAESYVLGAGSMGTDLLNAMRGVDIFGKPL